MNVTRVGGLVVSCLVLSLGQAPAATNVWTNDVGGIFSDVNNWQGGLAPGAGDTASFTNVANYAVTLSADAPLIDNRVNAHESTVTFNLAGFTLSPTNAFQVGSVSGRVAAAVVSNGVLLTRSLQVGASGAEGSLTYYGVSNRISGASGLAIGSAGTGRLTIADSQSSLYFPAGGSHYLGQSAGSFGALTVKGGYLSSTNGTLYVGGDGTGIFNLQGGTGVLSVLYLGNTAGSKGILTMSEPGAYMIAGLNMGNAVGADSEMYLSNGVFAARGETKFCISGRTLMMLNGGSITQDTGNTYLPHYAGTGVLVLASAQSTFYLGGPLSVGQNVTGGRGEIYVTNGTLNVASLNLGNTASSLASMYLYNGTAVVRNTTGNALVLANGVNSTGTVVMADEWARLNSMSTATLLGNNGDATLVISNGMANLKGISVANGVGSRGRVLVEDGQLISPTNGLTVGASGAGRLTLAHANAYLENIYATPNTILGGNAGGSGALYLSNGVARLRALQVGGNGVGYAEVQAATLLVDDTLFIPNSTVIQQYGNGADADIAYDGSSIYTVQVSTATNAWIGNLGGTQTRNVALVFQLPASRPLNSSARASMSFRLSDTSNVARTFNVDLYGVRHSAAATVLTNDYADGDLIQDNIMVPTTTNGTLLSTSIEGSAALSDWINALYDNGAVGNDYVVLGLRFDGTPDASSFYQVHMANSSARANQPYLNIQFDYGATGLLALASEQSTVFVSNTVRVGSAPVPASGTIRVSKGNFTAGTLEVGLLGNDLMEIGSATVNVFKAGGNAVKIGQGAGVGRMVLSHSNAVLNLPAGELWVGGQNASGEGHLIVSQGMVVAGFLQTCRANGKIGHVEIHDGSLTVLTNAFLGNSANSTSLVELTHPRSLLTVSHGPVNVGVFSNSLSNLILANGTLVAKSVGVGSSTLAGPGMVANMFIYNATSLITETSVATDALSIGGRVAATGTVLLAHSGAVMESPGRVYLGNAGVGRLIISNGTVRFPGILIMALSSSSVGEMLVRDGSLTVDGLFTLGASGSAVVNMDHPNALIALGTNTMRVADAAAGVTNTSVLNISNGTLTAVSGDNTLGSVGAQSESTGIINMQGGLLDLGSGNLLIGNRRGTVGILNLNAGTVVVARVRLPAGAVTEASTGTVVLSGGTLAVAGIESAAKTAGVAARSNLLFSGGTLLARGNFTNNLNVSLEASPGPGLVAIDTDGFDILQNGVLSGAGGLAKRGSGDLALTAANPYAGETLVQQGTLALLGSGDIAASTSITLSVGAILDAQLRGDGTLTIGAGQRVQGNGVISGTTLNNGVVAPGLSAGILGAGGPYSQTGTLEIELGGPVPGTGYDVLAVTGTATLDGALEVSAINAFSPASGQSFTVLTASAVSGTFATTNLPPLGGGLSWTVSYPGSAVVLTVSGSGPVATPYEIWADGFGLTGSNRYDQADPDVDGVANLMEYAQGSNPTSGVSTVKLRLGTMTNGAARLLIQRVNSATDVVYHVEGAYQVTNTAWSAISSNVLGTWMGPATVDDNNTGAVHEVRIVDPVAAATNRFLRLRVERP